MFILPSYKVVFELPADMNQGGPARSPRRVEWQVNTEEALESFCKTLRLNGISKYEVQPFGSDFPAAVNPAVQA